MSRGFRRFFFACAAVFSTKSQSEDFRQHRRGRVSRPKCCEFAGNFQINAAFPARAVNNRPYILRSRF